jgi:uncharacterized protein
MHLPADNGDGSTPRAGAASRCWRQWLVAAAALLLVVSLAWWFFTRDTLPREIRIAAGPRGGLYHTVADALKPRIEARTRRRVSVVTTVGTMQNRELVLGNRAELCLMQAGAVSMKGLAPLAPLYPDVCHVIVRKDQGIDSIDDLVGRQVAIGPEGSGTRELSKRILDHYGIDYGTDPDRDPASFAHFDRLLDDESLDAAVTATGLHSPRLNEVLSTGRFELLPIEDAPALVVRHRYLVPYEIPRGVFCHRPAVPAQPIRTIATTAVLVANQQAGASLVHAALEALYDEDLSTAVPTLIPPSEARRWPLLRLHETARPYFEPEAGLDYLNKLLGTIGAGKELAFAFGAALFLLWERRRRAQEQEQEAEFRAAKDRLDYYLNETVRIERCQIGLWDREALRGCLTEVTQVKLAALEELTQESLRSDRMFLIFLTQCASLIHKIQLKIELGGVPGQDQNADRNRRASRKQADRVITDDE